MNRSQMAARAILIALFAGTLYLMYRIFFPFLGGIIWSIVLAVAFYPLYLRLCKLLRGRRGLAAMAMSLLLAALIVVPCIVALVKVSQGAVQGYQWLQVRFGEGGTGADLSAAPAWVRDGADWIGSRIETLDIDLKGMALSTVKTVGNFLAGRTAGFLSGAASMLLNLIVMLILMTVFFQHGDRAVKAVRRYLPLSEKDRDAVLNELEAVTRSVFFGVLLTALAQGILGGMGTAIVGLPQPVTFAAATFLGAILPGGTVFVWGPAAIYLLAVGSPWRAAILVAWGAGVVSTADNFLRPLFIGRGVQLPGLLVFLGTLGGMIAFGMIGVFLGPLVITLFLSLLAILRRDLFPEGSAP